MLNLADMCVGILLLYYIVSGWLRGFWLSLLGPVSVAGCAVLAYQYYRENHNIYLGFAVVFLGPIVIRLIVGIVRWLLQEEGKEARPVFFSSILGAAISLTWGMAITAIMLLVLAMAPEGFNVPLIKQEVQASRSYHALSGRLAKAWPGMFSPPAEPKTTVSPVAAPSTEIVAPTEEERKKIEAIPEYQTLMNDDRILKVVENPETLEMIKAKNYSALLADENFGKILEDPELIMKLLQLYQKMGQPMPGADGQLPASTPETESSYLPLTNDAAHNFVEP